MIDSSRSLLRGRSQHVAHIGQLSAFIAARVWSATVVRRHSAWIRIADSFIRAQPGVTSAVHV